MVGPLRRCLFPGNLGFVAKFSVHRRVEPLGDRRFSDIEPGLGMTPGNSGNPGIRFAGAGHRLCSAQCSSTKKQRARKSKI